MRDATRKAIVELARLYYEVDKDLKARPETVGAHFFIELHWLTPLAKQIFDVETALLKLADEASTPEVRVAANDASKALLNLASAPEKKKKKAKKK